MDRPVATALVGFGYAGRTFHAPLITTTPDLSLTTIVSRQADDVRAAFPEARVVADLDAALADPAIELIVIATPNALHAPMATRALEAGKAVVIDKPFTVTLAEAQALVALSERTGSFLSVFHNRRWDGDFLAVRALIAEGRLGRVTRFDSYFDRFRPERRDRWRERDAPGGGIWHDLGPHLIDQALTLFGRPQAIQADIGVMREGDGAPDMAHAFLFYDRLRVGLHADMLSAAQPFRFAVHGDEGSVVTQGLDLQEDALKAGLRPGDADWPTQGPPLEITDGATGAIEICLAPPGDHGRYYVQVARAIRGRGPNPVPASEALAVMRVLEAGQRSSDEGRRIALDQ